jgi:hypothetical protein
MEKGIKVNGHFINDIRYADDTTLIADNITDLQKLLDVVNTRSMEYGLQMNINKTKFMVVTRNKNNVRRWELIFFFL